MASDRIDSIIDLAAVKGEVSTLQAEINKIVDLIKSTKQQSIDFNVNTKTISDYNKNVSDLNSSMQQMQQNQNAVTAAIAKNTQATQQANSTLEQSIALRSKLQNTLDSYKASLKEDFALLKNGSISQAEYRKRILESSVAIEKYKAKIDEVNARIKESFPTQKQLQAELKRQQKAADDAGNEYKQLSAAYNEAALKAKNYQLTLGASNPVTIAAVNNAKQLSNQLKKVDAAVGQNQRSVGDYAGGIQTAFSKIWGGLRTAANIIPGLGIGGLIGGIVASIGNLAASVASAAKPFKDLKEANEALNTAMASSNYQQAVSEVNTLRTEIQLAKEGFIDKKSVVDQYNETIGKTTGFVKDLNEAEQALNKNAEAYIRFTLLKAAANQVQEKAAKELVDAEIQNQKDLERIARIGSRDAKDDKTGISQFIKSGEENLRKAEQAAAAKRVSGLQNIADRFLKEAAELSKKFNFNFFQDNKEDKQKAEKKGRDLGEANRKALFEIEKANLELAKEFDLRRANDESKTLESRLKALESFGRNSIKLIELTANFEKGAKEIAKNEILKIENDKNIALEKLVVDFNDKLIKITKAFAVQYESEVLKPLSKNIPKELKKIQDDFAAAQQAAIKKSAEEAKKAIKSALETLGQELSNLFFTVLESSFERQKNAIQDQIDLLEQQKQKDIEVANQTITNAQDRADAIAVIEARAAAKRQQLELRQRQLDQQKAKFEKARAIAQIIANTAQGVTAALATIPPNPILAAIVGAIGAAQLATVLAQPIPRYAEGTDNHPGGKAVVGDGGKSEAVVMPDGSIYRTPSTSTVVDLPAGTKVYPDYDKMMINATMTKVPVFHVKTNDNSNELRQGFKSIVKAVKSIPQPIIHADRAWTQAHKTGSNFRNYINRSI